MKTQRKITIGLIICILAGIIGRCTGQAVEEIGTYPVSETNSVTLKEQPTFPVSAHEIDPVTRRLTFRYEAVSERKMHGLKNFARKLRRIFQPNTKT